MIREKKSITFWSVEDKIEKIKKKRIFGFI